MRPVTFAQTRTITAQIHPNALGTQAFKAGLAVLHQTFPEITISEPCISFQLQGPDAEIARAQQGMIRLLRSSPGSPGTRIQTTA